MESKYIIFLVFVGLAHASYVPTLIDNFGLSDADAAIFHQLVINQELTQTTHIDGIKIIFDSLVDQAVTADVDNSTVNAALAKVKESFDISFDSDVIVLGSNCSVDALRTAAHALLDDSFSRIYVALRLARVGNYSATQAEIEVQQAAIQENYVNLLDLIYTPVNTCLTSTDADAPSVIQAKKNGSGDAFVYLVNAIFNAIKTFAAVTPATTGDRIYARDNQEYWEQAINRVHNNGEFKYAVLRTLFLTARINQNGILEDLTANQYGLNVAFNKYRKAYDTMYGLVLYYLRRADFGIRDEGHDVFSRYDGALAEVNTRFASSGNLTLDAIPLINPAFAELLAILRDQLTEMSYEGDEAFLDVLDGIVAYKGQNYSEVLEIIEHYREIALEVYEPSNVLIYQFIRNNLTWSDELDARLNVLQHQANQWSMDCSDKYFDAVLIMARCRWEGKASQSDYDEIDNLLLESYTGVDNLLQTLFASGFYVLQEHSLNQVVRTPRRFVNLAMLN